MMPHVRGLDRHGRPLADLHCLLDRLEMPPGEHAGVRGVERAPVRPYSLCEGHDLVGARQARGRARQAVESPRAPHSTDSAASPRIASSCSGVGGLSPVVATAVRSAPWPAKWRELMLTPTDSVRLAQPSTSVQSHSVRDGLGTRRTWRNGPGPAGPTGNGEWPQLPVTSVVIP